MKRWKIVYDNYSKAVEKIYATVQAKLPYVLMCDRKEDEEFNIIRILVDPNMEGYTIKVTESQRVEITACDEINLLYAASDFKNVYLPFNNEVYNDSVVDFYCRKPFFEPLKPFDYSAKPKIKKRGIWTWGYTIYDYKRYIDNMVTLRMNALIIWNDFLPVNINDVIEYAHENGIKIYLGFAWGWDTGFKEIDISDTTELTENVVKKYTEEYSRLNCDGIYFQSFTELKKDNIGGVNIADAVINFVNRTAGKVLKINPKHEILFGLHATSVFEKIDEFKKLDDRISIIWEDLGAFPYHNSSAVTDGFEKTKELNLRIQNLRNGGFGSVLKSNYRLDWCTFEHHQGSYIMGVCDKETLDRKLNEKMPLLRKLQSDWIKNAKYAHSLIKDFNEDSMVTVLAEDGMFESFLSYPMALYAQMMWDSDRDIDEIMHIAAQMPDVDFA